MLHAISQLTQDVHRNVGGTLSHKVNTHALASDEPHHLLDFIDHCLRCVLKEHVRLIKEEDELGTFHVAHFGQGGVELRHEPQQESAVEFGAHHQFVGRQHAHYAFAAITLQQIHDVERRLSEKLVAALVFQPQNGTLDSSHGGRGDSAILCGVFLGMLAHIVQQRAQVLQVVEQPSVVVGNVESDGEHAGLSLIQLEQACQQVGPHLRHRGAHGVPLLAIDIIESNRARLELRGVKSEFRQSLLDEAAHLSGLADARQVALHVGHEAWHSRLAETFGHHLQRHRFSRTRGTGYESVTVGHFTDNTDGSVGPMGNVKPLLLCKHVFDRFN